MPCQQLRDNLLFNLSLSSNELFHSNLIAYIAEFFSDHFKGQDFSGEGIRVLNMEEKNSISVWNSNDLQSPIHRCVFSKVMEALGLQPPANFPIDNASSVNPPTCKYVYIVKREYRNFDISFWQWPVCDLKPSSKPKLAPTLLGVSELKFKSLPDPEQLNRYTKLLDGVPPSTTPEISATDDGALEALHEFIVPATFGVSRSIVSMVKGRQTIPLQWVPKNLDDLSTGIKNSLTCCILNGEQHCKVFMDLITQYAALLDLLHRLGGTFDSIINGNPVLDDLKREETKLLPCRMNATLQKLAYDWIRIEVLNELECRLQRRGYITPTTTTTLKPGHIVFSSGRDNLTLLHHAGMTHAIGLTHLGWIVSTPSGTISVGLQVQGSDFKCFVDVKDGSLKRTNAAGFTGPTIETKLLWGHLVPKDTCRSDSSNYTPSNYVGCTSLKNLNPITAKKTGTAVEFVASSSWFRSLITQPPNDPFDKPTILSPRFFVRPLFHGYNPGFCDVRFKIVASATLGNIVSAIADYMEWLAFGSLTTCPSSTGIIFPSMQDTDTKNENVKLPNRIDGVVSTCPSELSSWYKKFVEAAGGKNTEDK